MNTERMKRVFREYFRLMQYYLFATVFVIINFLIGKYFGLTAEAILMGVMILCLSFYFVYKTTP